MEEAIDYDADELEEQVVAPPLGAEMDAGQLLADLVPTFQERSFHEPCHHRRRRVRES